jgi:TonB family protein
MKLRLPHRVAVLALALAWTLTVFPGGLQGQDHEEGGRKIVNRVTPQYPNLARTMNMQGSVKADVLVAPNGTVKTVEIKGGHPLFVQAAQNALREWKWESAPHETHETVELKFSL